MRRCDHKFAFTLVCRCASALKSQPQSHSTAQRLRRSPQPKSSPLLPFPVVPARPIARYLLECSQPGRGENENPLLSWLVRASCAGPLVAAGPPSPIVVSEAGPDDRAGCFQYALCTPPACRTIRCHRSASTARWCHSVVCGARRCQIEAQSRARCKSQCQRHALCTQASRHLDQLSFATGSWWNRQTTTHYLKHTKFHKHRRNCPQHVSCGTVGLRLPNGLAASSNSLAQPVNGGENIPATIGRPWLGYLPAMVKAGAWMMTTPCAGLPLA